MWDFDDGWMLPHKKLKANSDKKKGLPVCWVVLSFYLPLIACPENFDFVCCCHCNHRDWSNVIMWLTWCMMNCRCTNKRYVSTKIRGIIHTKRQNVYAVLMSRYCDRCLPTLCFTHDWVFWQAALHTNPIPSHSLLSSVQLNNHNFKKLPVLCKHFKSRAVESRIEWDI